MRDFSCCGKRSQGYMGLQEGKSPRDGIGQKTEARFFY